MWWQAEKRSRMQANGLIFVQQRDSFIQHAPSTYYVLGTLPSIGNIKKKNIKSPLPELTV